jgi:hypothetical protein
MSEYPYLGFDGLKRPDVETEEYLRMWLAQDLRASIRHYALELGGAKAFVIEGTSVNAETGDVVKGALSVMRILGEHCFFLELDPETDRLVDDAVIGIDDIGHVDTRDVSMLTLAKAAAVCSPENSHLISHERYYRLKRAASQ